MTQRYSAARPASSRNGNALRYDVVWTLPFSEFSRVGYAESMTWWLDSIHGNEIAARKRFKAISEVVKANNGCALLFEVVANPRSSTFNLRVIDRSGHSYRPPGLNEINPVSVDVNNAFKQISAKWYAKNRLAIEDDNMHRTKRRPKRNHGTAVAIGALLALIALGIPTYYWLSPTASPSPQTAKPGVTTVRPQQRVIMPVRGGGQSADLCDVYAMSEGNGGLRFIAREKCPSQN